ncbi:MAG: type II toxin-antitoxin system VapC family toxin [Planctomycetaceae bacterium]|nr:type II toxin-antitoxin system VapC family toxin [Planctomycetaceae bacterium]
MNAVFLDTVGIIALLDEDDQWHAAAAEAYERVRRSGALTVSTPHVLLECGNAASRRPYRADVAELRLKLLQLKRLVDVTPVEEESAWTAYRQPQAGSAGIVDLISFAVMRRLGITEAFTNDRHFQAAGFVTLF